MPQVDYSKIVIYKIQHQELDELLYVGSTTHFGNRKRQHKGNCYNPNGKSYNSKLYSTIRDNGGWDEFNMVIVKEFPCENKRQAEAEEDKCIREMKSSLNMRKAYITKEEKQEYFKKYNKDFYQQNRERILQQTKEYNKDNIERKKEYNKEYEERNKEILKVKRKNYREQNKDKNKEYNKEYSENNKIKIKEQRRERDKEKIKCECDCMIRKSGLAKHLKTLKHQTFINQQTDQ